MKKVSAPILMIVFSLVLLVGCSSGNIAIPRNEKISGDIIGSFDMVDEYILCSEDGNLQLFVNPVTTSFYVVNKDDNSVWHSSPPNANKDPYSSGSYRMEMLANMIVKFENSETQVDSRFNTYTGSVLDEDFEIAKIKDGFRVDYHSSETDSIIPMCVYLNDGALCAEILADEIVVKDPVVNITDIMLLPFLGAGGPDLSVLVDEDKTNDNMLIYDEGYIFIADGSGAIINFNNGKNGGSVYERPVYGRDYTKVLDRYDLAEDIPSVSMPVFGIKRNEAAVLAIIENGAAISDIRALTNGQQTSFANVHAQFNYHEVLAYELGGIKAPVYENGKTENPSFSVRYIFLSNEDANYSGMARTYKEYFKEKYNISEQKVYDAALYLDLYGGVSKTVSKLGIQYNTIVPLTTTAEAKEIADILKNKGVDNIVVNYRSWNNDELKNKTISSSGIASKLNSKEYSFKDLLNNKDIKFYPALFNLTTYEKGNIIKNNFSTATDISGVTVKANRFAPGIGTALENKYYFITALKLPDTLSNIGENLNKNKINSIALSDVCNTLYNDYRVANLRRSNMQLLLEKSLTDLDKKFDILLNCPNDYAIPYGDDLFSVPTISSDHDLFDQDVPFYSMVVSGLKRYAASSFNNGFVGENAFLKAIESGSMPSYTWIYADASAVCNTEYSFLSGNNYKVSIGKATEHFKNISNIAKQTGNGAIYSHEKIEDGVYCTTYQSGLKVYVNYNQKECSLPSGSTVDAGSWLLEKGVARNEE